MKLTKFSWFSIFCIFLRINSSYNQKLPQTMYLANGLPAGLAHYIHKNSTIHGLLAQKSVALIVKTMMSVQKERLYEKLFYSASTVHGSTKKFFIREKKIQCISGNIVCELFNLNNLKTEDNTAYIIIQSPEEKDIESGLFFKKYSQIDHSYPISIEKTIEIIEKENSCTVNSVISKLILTLLKNFCSLKNRELLAAYYYKNELKIIEELFKKHQMVFLNEMAKIFFKKTSDEIIKDFNTYKAQEKSNHHARSNFIRFLLKQIEINRNKYCLRIFQCIKRNKR